MEVRGRLVYVSPNGMFLFMETGAGMLSGDDDYDNGDDGDDDDYSGF